MPLERLIHVAFMRGVKQTIYLSPTVMCVAGPLSAHSAAGDAAKYGADQGRQLVGRFAISLAQGREQPVISYGEAFVMQIHPSEGSFS